MWELDRLEDSCEPLDVLDGEEWWLAVLAVAEAFAEPGSRAVITPAVARLATEMAAVVWFSMRRPRSRSATARDLADRPVGNCLVSILKAWHIHLSGVSDCVLNPL